MIIKVNPWRGKSFSCVSCRRESRFSRRNQRAWKYCCVKNSGPKKNSDEAELQRQLNYGESRNGKTPADFRRILGVQQGTLQMQKAFLLEHANFLRKNALYFQRLLYRVPVVDKRWLLATAH